MKKAPYTAEELAALVEKNPYCFVDREGEIEADLERELATEEARDEVIAAARELAAIDWGEAEYLWYRLRHALAAIESPQR